MQKLFRTCVFLALGSGCFAWAQDPSAASLYKTNGAFGVRITVELKRDGAVHLVSPQAEFHGGDEIRLHFVSNLDGYVYALNETPSGETKVIFPTAEAGSNNMVHKDHDYTIPATRGWFRLEGKPGVEKVLMILSARALPEVDAGPAVAARAPAPAMPAARAPNAVADAGGAVNSTVAAAANPAAAAADSGGAANSTSKPGGKGNAKSQSSLKTANQDVNTVRSGVSMVSGVASIPGTIRMIPGLASRDLVFEDDVKQASTYVSAKPDGLTGPAIFSIALVHR